MRLLERIFGKKRGRGEPSSVDRSHALELIARGNVLEDAGQAHDALALYDAALELTPNNARGHLNRGNALMGCSDVEAAVAAFSRALEIDPDYAGAHFNLGSVYMRRGNLLAAQKAYTRALEADPDYTDAEVALGAVLDDLRQYESACTHYRRALELQPGYAQVHCNLGNSLKKLNRFDDAIASYRRAIELDPNYADAYNNMATVLQDLGRLEESKAAYLKALELDANSIDTQGNLLFVLNYGESDPDCPALKHAHRYGDMVAQRAVRYTQWNCLPGFDRMLRVGFVSGDFREHPVGFFFESALGALVRASEGCVQCVAYSNHAFEDATTQRLRCLFHEWNSCVGVSDAELARKVHEDAIDVLIDLSGHTASNRLPVFAFKPAPVQVSWLGYFGTTGVQAVDYLLADPWTLPEGDEVNFTENIWRLPETRLCFTPPSSNVSVASPPALRNGYITFGCFNNLTKMADSVVALWAQVLNSVPGSRLLLKSPQLNEVSVRTSVQGRFASHGVDPARLVFEGLSPRDEYLAAYGRVDIALDPFPYTGGTTTVEALWMGVPVLTLAGERFLSRQGVGFLMNVGLPDWIAENQDQYLALAKAHAADLRALSRLRKNLRDRLLTSPICNAPRFARHFEAALRGMWKVWCRQQSKHTT